MLFSELQALMVSKHSRSFQFLSPLYNDLRSVSTDSLTYQTLFDTQISSCRWKFEIKTLFRIASYIFCFTFYIRNWKQFRFKAIVKPPDLACLYFVWKPIFYLLILAYPQLHFKMYCQTFRIRLSFTSF